MGSIGGLPPFDFDPLAGVFTPAMAIRAGSLFAGAPYIQGKFDGSGTPDVLSFARGAQVHDNWYENFDPYQGTVVKWWVPEKDRDATQTNDEYIWYISSSYWLRYEHDNAVLRASIGNQEMTTAHTSVAGTRYCVVVRWDRQNKIDGTNYVCISVNDVHAFGVTTQPTIAAPGATEYIGSNAGATLPANAILEGLTFFRRVLRDSNGYGLDVNGAGTDELGAIYL